MRSNRKATDHTMPVSESLSLRLYSDTRPHLKQIATLQKGLILVYKGRELVGEGTGFGVPVARYRNRTYFSSSSTGLVFQKDHCTMAIKQFNLDTIYELRLSDTRIENRTLRTFARRLSELYEKHRHWRPILQQSLLNRLGMRNSFVPTKPAGKVTVNYRICDSIIHVQVDVMLSDRSHLQKVCILNEQSSRSFNKYFDSEGTTLLNSQIGAWDRVEADWACLTNEGDEAGFRLWKVHGATLYRGREFTNATLDWIGLDFELGPKTTRFEYDIEVFEGVKPK